MDADTDRDPWPGGRLVTGDSQDFPRGVDGDLRVIRPEMPVVKKPVTASPINFSTIPLLSKRTLVAAW